MAQRYFERKNEKIYCSGFGTDLSPKSLCGGSLVFGGSAEHGGTSKTYGPVESFKALRPGL